MRGARPERGVEVAIERAGAIRRGERVLIACSGGPDSVALVAALHGIAKPMTLELAVAHVNHGIRASAWQDECVVARIAATYELPLAIIALDTPACDEQTLRDARYAALLAAAQRFSASAIATAHHAQDQSETVLLALFRGTGPDGIGGMRSRRPVAEGIDLARPLLRTVPAELLAFCRRHGLPYAIDPTNADRGLRRNAVREALAALRPLFPGLDAALARAAELTRDERAATGRAALRREVRGCVAREAGLRDIDFAHVEAVVRAMESGRTGRFKMKEGVRLSVDRGSLTGIIKA